MADRKAKAAGAFSAPERWLAGRYLRARRQEGFISVIAGFSFLGIVLGVATLIVTLAVFNGFSKDLLDRLLGYQGHVVVYGASGPFEGEAAIADRVRAVPGVASASPTIDRPALLSRGGFSAGVAVKALRAEDFQARAAYRDAIVAGAFPEGAGVVIGRGLAEKGGIAIGDRVALLSPQAGGEGGVPKARAYPVTGILQIGVSQIDDGLVLMPLTQAQALFELGGRVTALEVFIDRPEAPDAVRDAITRVTPAGTAVLDWRQINGGFFGFIETQRNVVTLILGLIVLVAALNIISGIIMLVQDKGREIAILRTMGATRGMVMRVFLMAGASIGTVGTLAGMALGVAVAANVEGLRQTVQRLTGTDLFNADVYFLTELPSDIDPVQVGLVGLMAVGLSFLATLYPSWRAARLEPVEVLRHE